MANKILAILEQREGALKKVSFEAASVAAKLAKELNLEVEAIAVGSDINNLNDVSKYGISKIVHLKNPDFANYTSSGYTEAVSNYAKEVNAVCLIVGNTSLGNDLAPRLAVKLNSGCVMDCVSLNVESGEIIATRPIYAGKAFSKVKLSSDVKVFTIRPNVFKAEVTENGNAAIETKEISNPNL
ncbi:MAG TPA: electron transfer flavoprotein subunit alpha/FixB family protein, partial [Ignavibacteriaceae bacterium]|nr:electron transfer flavoprotein subunit alpha/FixB family protein [Ignavibacteriaceae bacterium]